MLIETIALTPALGVAVTEVADKQRLLDGLRVVHRFTYTHDWEVGDLVIWDNTAAMKNVKV